MVFNCAVDELEFVVVVVLFVDFATGKFFPVSKGFGEFMLLKVGCDPLPVWKALFVADFGVVFDGGGRAFRRLTSSIANSSCTVGV